MGYNGTKLELQRDGDSDAQCIHYLLDMGMTLDDTEGRPDRWVAHIDWPSATSMPQKAVDLVTLRLFELLKECFEQPDFYVVDSSRTLGKYNGLITHLEDTLEGFVLPGTDEFWNYMSRELANRGMELKHYKGRTGMLTIPQHALGRNI